MKRETQNILLLLLGGALIKIAVNGDYLRYVKPAQQPWIIAGGAVMVLLGAVAIVRDLLAARAAPAPASPDDGHGHAHSARPAWLLLVPVLAVFLVAPPALGADSVIRTEARVPASAAAANAASFPPLPAGDPVPLAVNEFVSRAGWDAAGTLNGRTVALTGFVVHNDGGTLLARLVISCCAADAFPVTVRLRGGEADHLASDAWIRVTGQVVPGTATRANSYTPDFTPASLATVPAPKDPYEY
ncbi:TIGR03943 family protein [Amycolatopsis sp. SID8362]|uniref:TIGR03943 family putative permease subunit n=1 Tax=Amycolatopsis sp. SID8362 TaxID=2690346 RepID=UPI001371446C|nr:TIGR03943 family protein [Amycolatopsis sp. SID8362]NBH11668.1 TIGR03943 family protein [Amycolatopsis sp. SID8362]NED48360.1 TIGR03943 family protein [Amycolatopsis sp. SID8362]